MLAAIFFDFDYTLGDSTKGIVLSVNFARKKLGYQEKGLEEIKRTVGLSLKETHFALTGKKDEKEALLFSKYFKEEADRVMVDYTELYAGVRENLLRLKNKGYKIGIVTTKFRYRIEQILSKFNACDSVDIIVGGDDVKIEKPNPEGLLGAIEYLGIDRRNALYVGDSMVDAKTAKNADVSFVGVLTGTTTRKEFEEYPNLCIRKHVNEICHDILEGLK
ncbi:MAG: HAD-IA family hydrolase [Clostridiales bacterium]|nr:HAD-IA family hydrolase [Clostridiales bacterium]